MSWKRWFHFSDNGIPPDKKTIWKDTRVKGQPPAIGWKAEILPDTGARKGWGVGATAAAPGTSGSVPASLVGLATPRRVVYKPPKGASAKDWPCAKDTPAASRAAKSNPNKKGSKSLPSSPLKKHMNPNQWPKVDPPGYAEASRYNNGPMKRATSFPNTQDELPLHKKGDKKTRYHKGNVYMEIDDDVAVEKETVLWVRLLFNYLLSGTPFPRVPTHQGVNLTTLQPKVNGAWKQEIGNSCSLGHQVTSLGASMDFYWTLSKNTRNSKFFIFVCSCHIYVYMHIDFHHMLKTMFLCHTLQEPEWPLRALVPWLRFINIYIYSS